MGNKVKDCPACGKEVAKSAKICPHCGKKLKMGFFLKTIIFIGILIVLAAIFGPTEEEKAQQQAALLESISNAQAVNLSPKGELYNAFKLISDYTDVQRDNLEKEIKDKVIQWTLPVYEVNKSGEYYRVQTDSGKQNVVSTFLNVYPRNQEERQFIEGLKTGDMITIKGKIIGTMMRNITIKPAVIVSK
ncbi:conserved hypothetical protein [Beggiatoa sp. PS]|nr:conserved hypothetical protein [Beggiatoa sp. PS]